MVIFACNKLSHANRLIKSVISLDFMRYFVLCLPQNFGVITTIVTLVTDQAMRRKNKNSGELL